MGRAALPSARRRVRMPAKAWARKVSCANIRWSDEVREHYEYLSVTVSGIGVSVATHLRHARTAMCLDGAVKDAEDNIGDVNLQHDSRTTT